MSSGVRRQDTYSLGQTIFCQFNHKMLKAAVKECAKDIGCHIWNGEPGSPDIIAIPSFIKIIDRRTVGKEFWKDYVEYCKEVDDNEPCMIVDAIKDWPLLDIKYFKQFDLKQTDSISAIINTIKNIRRQNLPAELQNKEFLIKQTTEMKYDESNGWVKSTYFKFV
jgi:hypothetical protein